MEQRSKWTRCAALLGLLVFVPFIVPDGRGAHQGPEDLNSVDLNLLVYHPTPDEKRDPWGVPAFRINGTWFDWMAGYYGAFQFPTAVVNGHVVIESTPAGEGGGPFIETYNAYRALVEEERAKATPVSIRLDAVRQHDALDVNVTFESASAFDATGLAWRLVLFEDDIGFNGGNGITNHRLVVRDLTSFAQLSDEAPFREERSHRFPVPSFISPGSVGVAAIVQNTRENSSHFKFKEVVQSATWTARQAEEEHGPTVQVARGVLLELYSATWCAACVYGDSATDQLANEMGIQSAQVRDRAFEYLRPGVWWQLALASAFGVTCTYVFVRRSGTKDSGSGGGRDEP